MIVPLKNAKTYGVLHTENYFSFLGFSKKVNSDEVQKVDVYLDDELIDTIIANKHLQKIEDIYELEGFGFEYILPNEYIGKKNLISFKNHKTQENLQNSPYKLITENHPEFNEMAFLNSLLTPIDEEKIKDVYCPNSIGFLATEENLEDEEFVHYIKELLIKFPNVQFKGFCFNESTLNLSKQIFKTHCIFKEISDSFEIFKNISIYLHNRKNNNEYTIKINQNIVKYFPQIYIILLTNEIKNILANEVKLTRNNYFFKNLEKFSINKSDGKDLYLYDILYNHIFKTIPNFKYTLKSSTTIYQLLYFDNIELTIKNKEFAELLSKIRQMLNIIE